MSEPLTLEFHLSPQFSLSAERRELSQFGLADRLLDVIRNRISGLDFPPKEVVHAAAQAAYQKYIASIDIPYVPNMIEPMIDSYLESLFLAAVDRMYDAIAAQKQAEMGS